MSILEKIVERKKQELARSREYYLSVKKEYLRIKQQKPGAFLGALQQPGISIIAEFKRQSPSAGVIQLGTSITSQIQKYEQGGACAVSVLTDREFFGGSIYDLKTACESTRLPVLRKDFILEEAQIYEAVCSGAAAVLLIAGILEKQRLKELAACAAGSGLDSLIEIRTVQEAEIAAECGAGIIGINTRNLHTFNVDFSLLRTLAATVPDTVVKVSESGVTRAGDIKQIDSWGFDAVLVGTALMRSGDPVSKLRELKGGGV